MDFKSFDFNAVLRKLMDPKSMGDLNNFLEKLPQNAGQTVLIAAGIAWAMAGALGLYTAIETSQLIKTREELKELQALKPNVPKIKDVPISKAEVQKFVSEIKNVYKGLDIRANSSTIVITAKNTAHFAAFREAVGHVQNGGAGWRVTVDKLCVGRECNKQHKLGASLKINKVSVEKSG